MSNNSQFLRKMAEFKGTTLVISATDTGFEVIVELDGQGVRIRPYNGEPCDVKIRATEQTFWAVFSGEMDADAAFFAGRVRISGSVVKAFCIKNSFLSVVQRHLARLLNSAKSDKCEIRK